MFEVPIIENITIKSEKEIILHFNTGIAKIIDIGVFKDHLNIIDSSDVQLNAEGILLNGQIIRNCDLWSMGKFCGWDKREK